MPRSATTNQRNHALEETASSRAERGGVRRWGWGLPDHAKHASERAETNTWVSTWTGEGILETGNTLRSRCEFGARGARLTHSRTATPGSNTAQASSLGEHGQIGDSIKTAILHKFCYKKTDEPCEHVRKKHATALCSRKTGNMCARSNVNRYPMLILSCSKSEFAQ